MKTKFLLSVFLFFFVSNCFGQITFQRVIGTPLGCQANAVRQTTDGNYILVGFTTIIDSIHSALYLIKTNQEGDTIWSKTFGTNNAGYSVQQTIDGGYIVAGSTYTDLYIVKTNAVGDTIWTKAYGEIFNFNTTFIQQTNDGGYIITGQTYSYGGDSDDVYLFKTDTNGDIIWKKTYGGINNNAGSYVKQTSDSGYIICGYTTSFGAGNADVYLIKTNANGDTLWTKTYGGSGNDYGNSVQQTTDGGYIITGSTMSFGAGSENVYLIKTNQDGDTLWTKTYGGSGYDQGNEVQQTTDSGYIITGVTSSFGAGFFNVYVIKTNSYGDTMWTKTYGGTINDESFSVKQTIDDGYIITGFTNSFRSTQGYEDIYLIKTDANGNSGCNQGTTNTIVGSTATQVGSTQTIIGSVGTAIPTTTIIGSGGYDSTLCLTTGMNELSIKNTISIYPNPATNQLTIHTSCFQNEPITVSVMNVLGEVMQEENLKWNNETNINIKNLSAGFYFLEMQNETGRWVGRFVKE